MRVEAVKQAGGFFIPLNDELKFVSQDRIALEIKFPVPEEAAHETPEYIYSHQMKHEAAVSLLQEWVSDESGYDESVWDGLKKTLEENRLSDRRRFDD
jgi:hypothetical protein